MNTARAAGLALAVSLTLSAAASDLSGQAVRRPPRPEPLRVQVLSADSARPLTIRFRVRGEPVATPDGVVASGTVTTPAVIEVPFAETEIVFTADPAGPELVLTARAELRNPALYARGHTVRLSRDTRGRVRVDSDPKR